MRVCFRSCVRVHALTELGGGLDEAALDECEHRPAHGHHDDDGRHDRGERGQQSIQAVGLLELGEALVASAAGGFAGPLGALLDAASLQGISPEQLVERGLPVELHHEDATARIGCRAGDDSRYRCLPHTPLPRHHRPPLPTSPPGPPI